MWNDLQSNYFNSDITKKNKFFLQYDSKRVIKSVSQKGIIQFSAYALPKSITSVESTRLSSFLLGRFNLYSLLMLSVTRELVSNYLIQVAFLNLFFIRYIKSLNTTIVPALYHGATKNFNRLVISFYKKLLVLYTDLFFCHGTSSVISPLMRKLSSPSSLTVARSFFGSNYIQNTIKTFYVLYLKVSLNNVFITLTKNGSDVLLSLSGGQTSSKKKKNTLTVFFLLSRVITFLQKNNIKSVNFLIIRSSWYRLANVILAPLKKKNIKVDYVGFDFIRSHNGLRKKKIRRL